MSIIDILKLASLMGWLGILSAAFLIGYVLYLVFRGDDHISKRRPDGEIKKLVRSFLADLLSYLPLWGIRITFKKDGHKSWVLHDGAIFTSALRARIEASEEWRLLSKENHRFTVTIERYQ